MKAYIVTVTANGETKRHRQPAQSARDATNIVKAFYYSMQDVETRVKVAK